MKVNKTHIAVALTAATLVGCAGAGGGSSSSTMSLWPIDPAKIDSKKQAEDMMSSQKGNKNYMKLITFFCNTSNPLQFLHWYNSVEVRARLYDFNNIKMVENGIYPTFVVEQYSGLLPNKNRYQMVRQI